MTETLTNRREKRKLQTAPKRAKATEINSRPQTRALETNPDQSKTTETRTHHTHTSKNNRKSKGRNNNPSGEEIRQFPTGTAGRVGVICDPFGNEVGDGGDEVENQDEQGPVNAIVLQGTSQHKKSQPNCPTEGERHESCRKHNHRFKVLVGSRLGETGPESTDGPRVLFRG